MKIYLTKKYHSIDKQEEQNLKYEDSISCHFSDINAEVIGVFDFIICNEMQFLTSLSATMEQKFLY